MPVRRGLAAVSGAFFKLAVAIGLAITLSHCARERPPSLTYDADDPSSPPSSRAGPALPRLAPTPVLPNAAEARRLATTSFTELARAIKARQFTGLYQSMAPSFRDSVSLQRVADGFRPFTSSGVDLTTADPKLLTLTGDPELNERGVLIVRGFQPTPAQKWFFEFGFVPSEPGWALTAMSLLSAVE